MFFDLLFFLNISISFLTAFFLWFKLDPIYYKKHTQFLGWYLFLNAFCFSFYLLIKKGLIIYVPFLYKLPAPITYLIYPAAYFHICFLLKKNRSFKVKDLLHLLLFIVFLVSYLPFYFESIGEKSIYVATLVNDMSKIYSDNVGLIPEGFNNLGRVIIPLFYLVLQWRIVLDKKNKYLKAKTKVLYRWSVKFVSLQTYYVISLYIASFSSEFFFPKINNIIANNLTSILTVIFFFSLSFTLFWNQTILRKLKTFNPSIRDLEGIEIQENQIEKISRIVYEKKYFKDNKNLQGVSDLLNYDKTELSKIINKNYPSFNSWINHLKIRYCIELLNKDYLSNYSIEALANECGFNSRATFYRAFKVEKNMTPKEYILKNKTT